MQTVYNTAPRAARAGMLSTLAPHFIRTGLNEEAASIPYGVALKLGTEPGKYKLPAAAGDRVCGIAVFEHTERLPNNNVSIGSGLPFNLLVKGCVTVPVEEAVTEDDVVYVRHTANGAGKLQLGAFRKSDDGGTASIVHGARYLTAAAANGLAVVEFDALTNAGLANLETSLQSDLDDAEDAFELRTKSVEINLDHAQATDTATTKFFRAPAAMVVDSVDYINPTGLAEHAENYFTIAVKNGDTVVASKNTKEGEGGTLAADEFVALTNGDLAARTLAAGDVLALALTIAGTGVTLPAGRVVVHGHYV